MSAQSSLRFWGKTRPQSAVYIHSYKPLLHHLLDVAATALRLQEVTPARLKRDAEAIGVRVDRLASTTAFLIGLHDLGKFSVSFQAKVPELWPQDVLGVLPDKPNDRGHWRNTAIILRWREAELEIQSLFPNLSLGLGLQMVSASVAGHHGRPPTADETNYNRYGFQTEQEVTGPCLTAALEAMHFLRDLIRPEPWPEITDAEQMMALSWRLAGLTTLADWVGSDSDYFTFEDPGTELADYWRHALTQAEKAVTVKGLLPSPVRADVAFADLVPDVAPRPMQVAAATVTLPHGPALFVLEDTTGSGKTEAALAIASRLMGAGRAEGIYFALPTMATANAMHVRLGDIRRRLYSDRASPSLVLAHGRAALSRDLMKSTGQARNGYDEDDDDSTSSCAEWIADDRRKAFFADIGAGTIDQAFLAILKKKHLTLRQYGLAGRILIVDEAHAFDAYM
ncbi:MAG: CRISPR-associated endonuclease Cas3'', partial [Rhodospirillaceae bacterium]